MIGSSPATRIERMGGNVPLMEIDVRRPKIVCVGNYRVSRTRLPRFQRKQ